MAAASSAARPAARALLARRYRPRSITGSACIWAGRWRNPIRANCSATSSMSAMSRRRRAATMPAAAQRMHSDNCDLVSLMCVRAARSGGISRIVSAAAVHNALLETRPDLLEALYGEWVFRRMELDAQYGTGPLTKTGGDLLARERPADLQCLGQLSLSRGQGRRRGDDADADRSAGRDGAHRRLARSLSRHEHRRGRHPVPQQPRDPARPHRLRRPAGDRDAAGTC